jgi:hypothetical protein
VLLLATRQIRTIFTNSMSHSETHLPKRDEHILAHRVERLFWLVAVILAFAQAWVCRFTIVNDTISYLDIGDLIWHGHWSAALNGIWNPFYPILLGGTLAVLHPTALLEYPLVHLLLFIIFVVTLCCFSIFLKEMILLRSETVTTDEDRVAEWVWILLGYTLFLWSSLRLIGVGETNPDMVVAAVVYMASALVVRIFRAKAGGLTYLSLGVTLGVGYLTKSIMFPISVLWVLIVFIICLSGRGHLRRACITALAFFAISVPFIASLSAAKGRLTFGDSGRYNYAVHVNGVTPLHWQGSEPGSGIPVHPTRQLVRSPATYEFGSPLDGTYPPWYDPSYWYEGVKPRLQLREQLHTTKQWLHWESDLFFGLNGAIVCGLFILFFVSKREALILKDVLRHWFILIPCVAALALYSLVHVESRYVAAFVVILTLCLFFSIHLPAGPSSHRLFPAVATFTFLAFISFPLRHPRLFVAPLDWVVLEQEDAERQDLRHPFNVEPGSYQEAVGELDRIGIRPGDRIASLDCSLLGISMLARLARIKIVAEVNYWPEKADTVDNFWQADSTAQSKVVHALATTGARAIISELPPRGSGADGWHRVGTTRYYIYWLG